MAPDARGRRPCGPRRSPADGGPVLRTHRPGTRRLLPPRAPARQPPDQGRRRPPTPASLRRRGLLRAPSRNDAPPHTVRHRAPDRRPGRTALGPFARTDLTFPGARIGAGDTVLLSLTSAHRDPAVRPDPHRSLPSRAPKAHLAFGRGPHHCLGAALARVQLQTALGHLLHLPGLALLPGRPVRYRNSLRLHGFDELPVGFGSADT
ncbi:cytochrome P450 [Streptomyces sp. NPDC059525]|uniref:cytochrome P450 n=1 Tax=Streptomyces sp. NPDC059525 TaxID=3346857 RepID=UPI00368F9378